jgi:hypothetical protein
MSGIEILASAAQYVYYSYTPYTIYTGDLAEDKPSTLEDLSHEPVQRLGR